MSVPTKETKSVPDASIKAAILDAVSELYDEHTDQIRLIRERAEGKVITVNFANEIDCSESQPVVKTKIRFCETYTDERTNKLEDTDQGTFETLEAAGRGGRKTEGTEDSPSAKSAKGDGKAGAPA